ncbi:MAG TPA: sugar phosphate isomerase/epimerase family protein [Methylomirabilota bacterium]|nr:sugar phosphate isomerase/epimerase family protein [Methylomirabilota bacterium]
MTEMRSAGALRFRLSLCNEVLRDRAFAEQCRIAATLGYDGLEIAPFTLSDDPRRISPADVDRLRTTAAEHGIAITGLHWLLVSPPGLSITDADPNVRRETAAVIAALIGLCRDLGGTVLVHGSPQQRVLPDAGSARAAARGFALDQLARAGDLAAGAGVTYCIEPLAEANFVRTVDEAIEILDEIDGTGLATMLDTSAAGQAESEPVAEVLDRALAAGRIAHVQINAVNRKAPGQGPERLAEVFGVLDRHGYDRTVAVEPFIYEPDGLGSAAFAAGYVRGLSELVGGWTQLK